MYIRDGNTYVKVKEDEVVSLSRIRELARIICEANNLPMVTIVEDIRSSWTVDLKCLEPNGYCNDRSQVYINPAARLMGEDTVLPILAHEIAHNALNHLSYTMYNHWSPAIPAFKEEVSLSRFQEMDADRLGHRYLVKAGFNKYLTLGLMILYLKSWLEEKYVDRPRGSPRHGIKRIKGARWGGRVNRRHPLRDVYESQKTGILHFEHYLRRSNFYKNYLMKEESHPHPLERIENILKEL